MTKEIIIDGVDVKPCIYYGKNNFDEDVCYMSGFNTSYLCRLSPNCYYKQLQREKHKSANYYGEWQATDNKFRKLEQTLKEKNLELITAYGQNQELVKNNNRLAETIDLLDERLIEKRDDNSLLKQKVAKLQNRNQQLDGAITKVEILTQTLKEVREIAEKIKEDNREIGCNNCAYRNVLSVDNAIKILENIKEVE